MPTSKKILNIKKFSILLIILIFLISFTRIFFDVFMFRWHFEPYLLEGQSYIFSHNNKIDSKKYFIAEEEISIEGMPQTSNVDYYHYEEKKGPYTIKMRFENALKKEKKEIIIHNIEIKSKQGEEFPLSEKVKFPIIIEGKPTHYNSKKITNETELYYDYFLSNKFDFNFQAQEIILISLDIEINSNQKSARGEETFRLLPILDKGMELRQDL